MMGGANGWLPIVRSRPVERWGWIMACSHRTSTASLLGTPGGVLGVLTSFEEGPACGQATTVGRLWVSICTGVAV
jgi:hypothetical protein